MISRRTLLRSAGAASLLPAYLRHNAVAGTSGFTNASVLVFDQGQSNADGAGNVDLLSSSRDYSLATPPIFSSGIVSGNNSTVVPGWFHFLYKRSIDTGLTLIDPIDGAFSGTAVRGERTIHNIHNQASGGVSHLAGLASRVANDGHYLGATSVRIVKWATFGVRLDELDPYYTGTNGGTYRNGKRVIIRQTRSWVAGERAANRTVYAQIFRHVQGEGDASADRALVGGQATATPGATPNADAYAAKFKRMYSYYAEKIGQKLPWVVHQLVPIRVSNSSQAAFDFYTANQNAVLAGLCRFNCKVSYDYRSGLISIKVTDLGASAGRIDQCYFLEHDLNVQTSGGAITWGPETAVHYYVHQYIALGKAIADLERYIAGNTYGLTNYPITRIAPVIMETPTVGVPLSTSCPFTIRADEACSIFALALPAKSPIPTANDIVAEGQVFKFAENSLTDDGTSPQTFILRGLLPATSYLLYTCAKASGIYGSSGDVGSIFPANGLSFKTST